MNRLRRYITAPMRYNRSKGFGIHSPFAYDFVTTTLRERCRYYGYSLIESCRGEVCRMLSGARGRHRRVISLKGAKRLFRIVCRFNPSAILEVGNDYGVALTAMLEPCSLTQAVILNDDTMMDDVAGKVLGGRYDGRVKCVPTPAAARCVYDGMSAGGMNAFVVVNAIAPDDVVEWARYVLSFDTETTVVVIRNMASKRSLTRELYDRLTREMSYGMTFFNDKTAVVVLRRSLPLQHFALWF